MEEKENIAEKFDADNILLNVNKNEGDTRHSFAEESKENKEVRFESIKQSDNGRKRNDDRQTQSNLEPLENSGDKIMIPRKQALHVDVDVIDEFERRKIQLTNLLNSSAPVHRLETMSSRGVLKISIFYCVFLFLALVDGILYATLIGHFKLESLGLESPSIAFIDASIYLQLAIQTFAYGITLFLVISFPQRILRRLYSYGKIPTPEQTFMMLLLLLLFFFPLFTWGALQCNYEATIRFQVFMGCFTNNTDSNDELCLLASILPPDEKSFYAFIVYSTIFYQCEAGLELNATNSEFNADGLYYYNQIFLVLFLGILSIYHTFMTRTPWLVVSHRAEHQKQEDDIGDISVLYDQSLREQDIENYQLKARIDESYLEYVSYKVKKVLLACCNRTKALLSCCNCHIFFKPCKAFRCGKRKICEKTRLSLALLWPAFTFLHISSVFFYVIYMWSISLALDFFPSVVPVVSVITLFRVCLYKKEGVHQHFCDEGRGFQRACAIGFAVVFEIYLFIYLPRQYIKAAKTQLSRLPYAQNRSKHLSFQYFQLVSTGSIFIILISSIILCTVQPVWVWVYTVGPDVYGNADDLIEYLNLQEDPLYAVGVTGNSAGFISFYVVFVAWIFTVALSFLPEDSQGFIGWFCGKDEHKRNDCCNEYGPDEESDYSSPPLYLLHEKDERILKTLNRGFTPRNEMASKIIRKVPKSADEFQSSLQQTISHNQFDLPSTNVKQSKSLGEMPTLKKDTPLYSILKNNLFVMELAIQCFNFAHAVYAMSPNQAKKQQSKLIFDDRFTLEKFIFKEESHTCVLICSSSDRIIVAFRGTVSSKNVKTDLKFDLHVYEEANSFAKEQGFSDDEKMNFSVHNGFYTALRSVSKEIEDEIRRLVNENPSRAVLFTGHSLGGGLSVLCAFETFVNIKPVSIGVLTWGCPKIGCDDFRKLYDTFIPYTMRFVVIRDVIPALRHPWHLKAYFHVGIEIIMDFQGTLIFQPSFIERSILLKFRRMTPSNHFMSKYALALMLWNIRAHFGEYFPDFWLPVKNHVLKACTHLIKSLEPVMSRTLLDVLKGGEGVEYTGKGSVHLRNMAIQTDESIEIELIHDIHDLETMITELPEEEITAPVLPLIERLKSLTIKYEQYKQLLPNYSTELEMLESSQEQVRIEAASYSDLENKRLLQDSEERIDASCHKSDITILSTD